MPLDQYCDQAKQKSMRSGKKYYKNNTSQKENLLPHFPENLLCIPIEQDKAYSLPNSFGKFFIKICIQG